jgi:hypothetical protein
LGNNSLLGHISLDRLEMKALTLLVEPEFCQQAVLEHLKLLDPVQLVIVAPRINRLPPIRSLCNGTRTKLHMVSLNMRSWILFHNLDQRKVASLFGVNRRTFFAIVHSCGKLAAEYWLFRNS